METQVIVENVERTESPLTGAAAGFTERTRILTLVALSILVYANTLVNSFALDDFLYIFKNPAVTSPSLKLFFSATRDYNVFRPITFISLATNWALGGSHPWGYHLVNLLLHAAVTLLLYVLLKDLLQNFAEGNTTAWVAALLFAVHPIHTEAVANVVNRSELLAAGFLLAAWLLHLRAWPLSSLLCFLLAMMAKESAVVFLPLVVLGDYVRGKWMPFLRYAGVTLAASLYMFVLWKAQGGRFGEVSINFLDNPLAHLPVALRVPNAIRVAWKYIALQLYPSTLSCDYSYNAILLYSNWQRLVLPVIAALAVFGLWIGAVRTGKKAWVLAGGIYLVAFAVTANILIPTGTIMGERLAYLPSAGFCLLIALACLWFARQRRQLAWILLIVIATALSVRTVVRNQDWRNNFTLFSTDVQAVPRSAKLHGALAGEFIHRNLDSAKKECELALAIYPDIPQALSDYGIVQSALGHDAEALRLMERSLSLVGKDDPNYDSIALSLAIQLMKLKEYDPALNILNQEIAKAPGNARALSNRAVILYQRGDTPSARSDAQSALRLDPSNRQAQNLLELLNKLTPQN